MPLIDRHGVKAESFKRAASLQDAAQESRSILPWRAFIEGKAAGERFDVKGVEILNDIQADEVMRHLDGVDLVAIGFPGFGDGRGFSIARQLRRLGYTGTLRATGPLIPDQLAQLVACGFDEVEISEDDLRRKPAGQWKAAYEAISQSYQGASAGKTSILEQRRIARRAPQHGSS